MRMIEVAEFGGPEVLRLVERPDPVAGDGQVLVAVRRAGVTFVETRIRAGLAPWFGTKPPYTPGSVVAGTVAGTAGRVVCATGGSGGYADLAVVPAEEVLAIPDGVTDETAVAAATDARTAMMLFDAVRPSPGERVLVEAAGGGVGTILIQLAKRAGAVVVAAARGSHKLEQARGYGADEALDYTSPGWAETMAPVHVLFESVGGEIGAAALTRVADGGRISVFGLASGVPLTVAEEEAGRRRLTVHRLGGQRTDPTTMRGYAARALDETARGLLRPLVGQTFPLAGAADAHRAVEERRTVGKTVLIP